MLELAAILTYSSNTIYLTTLQTAEQTGFLKKACREDFLSGTQTQLTNPRTIAGRE